jgi:hypothetical protein
LEEDIDAPLSEALLQGIAFFDRDLARRPYDDIRILIFIDRLGDLDGGFWAELLHIEGKFRQDAVQASVYLRGRLI